MEKKSFVRRYRALGWKFQDVRPAAYLRVNTLKTESDVLKKLKTRGVQLEKVTYLKDGYKILHSPFSLGSSFEYLLGFYYLQGAAAQIPVQVLAPTSTDTVMDCCASPGGKLTQIAQFMANKGVIVAFEKKKERLGRLGNNLERLGVTNTIVYHKDAKNTHELGLSFDKILVDTPCSGNFTQEKGWFSKRSTQDFEAMSKVQRQIIKSALSALKPGGVLVYSTCSLEPEENEMVVDYAVRDLGAKVLPTGLEVGVPGVCEVLGNKLHESIQDCRRIWPAETEGFFIAKLTK